MLILNWFSSIFFIIFDVLLFYYRFLSWKEVNWRWKLIRSTYICDFFLFCFCCKSIRKIDNKYVYLYCLILCCKSIKKTDNKSVYLRVVWFHFYYNSIRKTIRNVYLYFFYSSFLLWKDVDPRVKLLVCAYIL